MHNLTHGAYVKELFVWRNHLRASLEHRVGKTQEQEKHGNMIGMHM
jgi:hypothetical protein